MEGLRRLLGLLHFQLRGGVCVQLAILRRVQDG